MLTRVFWLCLSLLLSCSARAQVLTENAGAISPETPILRQTELYLDYSAARELRYTPTVIWSPDPQREFRLSVPYVWKMVDFAGGSTFRAGLGDVTLRYKQSLWQENDVMASERWAFLAEVGLPTGPTDSRDGRGVTLPPRLQIGSGSFSLGAGTAYTLIKDRHRFSVEAFYRHYLPASGTHFGSTAELNLAYWYRISPAQFPEDEETPVEVRGVLELLSVYRFSDQFEGNSIGKRGALVWLAPGLQIYPEGQDVLLEGALLIPVAQSLNDELGKRRWGLSGTIKILF